MEYDRSPPSVVSAGLACRCPRCGRGRLLDGFLAVRPSCEACGLDFAFADAGDGPAFFVMSIVGILIVLFAMIVEFRYEPPLWVHAVLWVPLTFAIALILVRPAKGLLIALQFHNRAEEGRLKR